MKKSTDWFLELPSLPRGVRVTLIAGFHLVVFTGAFVGAFAIRFDFQIPHKYAETMWQLMPIVLGVKLAVFLTLKMFRGWWRYVSLHDVLSLGRALGFATGALVLVNVFVVAPDSFPRSIYLIDFGLAFLGLAGARGSLRLLREAMRSNLASNEDSKRLLILGAGDTGESLVREINKNKNLPFRPIAFLDDDVYRHKLRIHGVPVLGSCDLIEEVVEAHNIEQIIIAMPSAGRDQLRAIYERSRNTDAEVKILPALESMLSGELALSQLREVSISDLLGRAPVKLDSESMAGFLAGRTVMVTGAGGSIGSELCRQVLKFNPKKLVMVERAETPLFLIERELRNAGAEQLEPCIANVCDRLRMEAIFRAHRPDVVLHAAAYKHVPLMEAHPDQAVLNNIVGTKFTAELAAEYKANAFVLISTDKAVNPTSVMGATKRIAELSVQGLEQKHSYTKFCAVRFGNVLGSNGSVVPIFRNQIKEGGPVTVTHPDMTRYFMTIPEASQLVLQSAAIGKGGELFILDMGEPVKIVDLARDMIRLSGLTEDDVEIVFTGRRPGEKLFEELTLAAEDVDRTRHDKIFVGKTTGRDFEAFELQYLQLIDAAQRNAKLEVRRHLKSLLPNFVSPDVPDNIVELDSSSAKESSPSRPQSGDFTPVGSK